MTAPSVTFIESAANAQLKELRRLAQDSTAYRSQGSVWIEGDHLCSAALARGLEPLLAVYSQSYWPTVQTQSARTATKIIVLTDPLFASISALPAPAAVAMVIALPLLDPLQPAGPTVVLDRLQDAGNVGSILRSSAAFGFGQVLALKGTAALWSPKVVRAGMGAHFGLQLHEGLELAALDALALPLVTTSSHGGHALELLMRDRQLPWPCTWVFGHEGQGVADALAARATLAVRIAQPGGEESLNVAAAAAICLHASASSRA